MNISEKINYIKEETASIQSLIEKGKELDEITESLKHLSEALKNMDPNDVAKQKILLEKEYNYHKKIESLVTDLKKMNEELEKFDRKELSKALDYLKIYSEFQKLTEEIQMIEKLSSKSNQKKSTTENAEGKKKEIDTGLIHRYELCVQRKKELKIKYLKTYNALMDYDINLLKKKENDPNLASFVNPDDFYDAKPEEMQYQETASEEEKLETKLKKINEEIKEILSNTKKEKGTKVHINFEGKEYDILKKNHGKLLYLNGQRKQLEKSLAPEKEEKNTEKVSPSNIKIVNIDRKKKQTFIQKIKKIAISACIGIMTISSVSGIKTAQLQKEVKQIEANIDHEMEESEIEQIVSDALQKENQESVQTGKNETALEPVEIANLNQLEDSYISLGETFTINEDAKIFSDEYKATKDKDGKKPHFENDKERENIGVVFELPNGEIKVAKTEKDILKYQENGGTVTAYLAGNENGVEGFYQDEDIVVNEKGGRTL